MIDRLPLVRLFAFLLLVHLALGCAAPPASKKQDAGPEYLLPKILTPLTEDGAADEILPAKIRFLLRFRNTTVLAGDEDSDPIGREMREILEAVIPPALWRKAAIRLDKTEQDLVRELFRQDLNIVELRVKVDGHSRRDIVVLTQVDTELLDRLPAAAELRPWLPHPRVGPFALYAGEADGHAYVLAVGKRWLAFSNGRAARHLIEVLTSRAAGKQTLAEDAGYLEVVDKLLEKFPEEFPALLYTRNHGGKNRHAVAATRKHERIEAHYVARTPSAEKYLEALASSREVDFGPLPASVLAAGTLNIITKNFPAESALDLLVFPSSFRNDVLPHVSLPIIMFLGTVPREEITPDPGFTVPVVGLALHLKNPEVADLLDRLVSRAHFLVSMGRLAVIEGFFGIRSEERPESSYRVADFGPAILARAKNRTVNKLMSFPAAQAFTDVAFGRIGSYFVICTQEAFLRQWHESLADESRQLENADNFPDFELTDQDGLIFSGVTRGRELSKVLDDVAEHVREASVSGEEPDESGEDARDQAIISDRVEQPLRWIADVLGEKRTFSVQVWHSGPSMLQGKLVVLK
jgi:hypothetical protein